MDSNLVRNPKWSDGDKSDLLAAGTLGSGIKSGRWFLFLNMTNMTNMVKMVKMVKMVNLALLLNWSRVVGTAHMVAPRDSA